TPKTNILEFKELNILPFALVKKSIELFAKKANFSASSLNFNISKNKPASGMLNIYDFVTENWASRKFRVDELLFLDYDCPVDDERLETWTHISFFFYMLRGNLKWKTPEREYAVKTGEAVFIKKGAQLAFKELNHHFCALLFFVPDEFIR